MLRGWGLGLRVRLLHGGLRTFHQKSTYPEAINFKALCGTILVTLPPIIWGERTLRSPPSGVAVVAFAPPTVS